MRTTTDALSSPQRYAEDLNIRSPRGEGMVARGVSERRNRAAPEVWRRRETLSDTARPKPRWWCARTDRTAAREMVYGRFRQTLSAHHPGCARQRIKIMCRDARDIIPQTAQRTIGRYAIARSVIIGRAIAIRKLKGDVARARRRCQRGCLDRDTDKVKERDKQERQREKRGYGSPKLSIPQQAHAGSSSMVIKIQDL